MENELKYIKIKSTTKSNGITLIALVITIVVLLILAGISMSTLTNTGIIRKAQEAKFKSEEAQKEEIDSFENIDKIMYGAPIPENFYYVGGTADTGLVISDKAVDENAGIDYQATLSLKGNQFVWIPVSKAICDETVILENTSDKESAINDVINNINADTNKKGYPMSIKVVNGIEIEYVSVLYNTELIEKSENNIQTYSVSFTALPYSRENGDYREPDIASTSDSMKNYLDILNFTSINNFEKELHDKYNKMVESVNKYGGFYVARYETTIPDRSREEDKNEGSCSFKAGRDVEINTNWYQFSKMHENYGISTGSNIYSNSIWGCQWDQMMLFMKDIKNELNGGKPYIISAENMAAETNDIISKSASKENNYTKNIFDVAGNVYEYTLETRSATTHTKRSSCYQKGASPYASKRSYVIIQNDSNVGSKYDGGRCSFILD